MKRNKNHWLAVLCIAFVIFVILGFKHNNSLMANTASAKSSNMEFHYLDVAHGDSIIIRYPHGKVVLIDAGKEEYGEKVVAYLKNMGITKIDYVIASHYDMDHIGGMPAVLDSFKVGKFYGPNYRQELKVKNTHYKKLVDKLKEKNISLRLARTGMVFKIDGVDNYILGPVKRDYKYPNDHSIVMKTVYNKTSFLFTGDLPRAGEKDVTNRHVKKLDVDVLKVAHHGYEGSSSENFLKLVTPKISIISGGNTEKAPIYNKDVYNRLKDIGSEIYTTLDNGDIVLTSNGVDIKGKVQKGDL